MKKLLFWFFITHVCFAQYTPTPNIGLQIPSNGSNNWNLPLNYNFNRIDLLLSGNVALPGLSISGNETVTGSITAGSFIGAGGSIFVTGLPANQYSPAFYNGVGSTTIIGGITPVNGILKWSISGPPSTISYSDIVALWSGTCTGTNVLQANGSCGTGGGSGGGLTSFQGRTTAAATLQLSDVNGLGTISNSTTGNAATSTAFASTPTPCGTGLVVQAIAANGTLTCVANGSGGGLTSFQGRTAPAAILQLSDISGLGTLSNSISGNASTATAANSAIALSTGITVSGSNGIGVTGSPVNAAGTIGLSLGNITPLSVSVYTGAGGPLIAVTQAGSSYGSSPTTAAIEGITQGSGTTNWLFSGINSSGTSTFSVRADGLVTATQFNGPLNGNALTATEANSAIALSTGITVSGSNGIGVTGSPVNAAGTIGLSLGNITPLSVSVYTAAGGPLIGVTQAGTSYGSSPTTAAITASTEAGPTNYLFSGVNSSGTSTFYVQASGLVTATQFNGPLNGNASTATAANSIAGTLTQCSSPYVSVGITNTGNANCIIVPSRAYNINAVTRSFNTTYHNTTGYPLYVTGWGTAPGGNDGQIQASIGSTSASTTIWANTFTQTVVGEPIGFTFNVPVNWYYSIQCVDDGATCGVGSWFENTY